MNYDRLSKLALGVSIVALILSLRRLAVALLPLLR